MELPLRIMHLWYKENLQFASNLSYQISYNIERIKSISFSPSNIYAIQYLSCMVSVRVTFNITRIIFVLLLYQEPIESEGLVLRTRWAPASIQQIYIQFLLYTYK